MLMIVDPSGHPHRSLAFSLFKCINDKFHLSIQSESENEKTSLKQQYELRVGGVSVIVSINRASFRILWES